MTLTLALNLHPDQVQLGEQDIASCQSDEDGTGLLWLVFHLQPEKLQELQVGAATAGRQRGAISVLLEREQLRTVHGRFLQRLPPSLQLGGMAAMLAQPGPAMPRPRAGAEAPPLQQPSMPAARSAAAAAAPVAAAAAATAQRVSSTTPLQINASRPQPVAGGTPRLCITGAAPTAAASSPATPAAAAATAAAAAAAARRVSSTPPMRIGAPQPRPAAGGGVPAAAAAPRTTTTPAAKPQGRSASNHSVTKRQIRPLQLADDKGGSVRKVSATARPLCISHAPKDSQDDWEVSSE